MTNDKLKNIIEYYTYGDEDVVNNIVVLEGDEFADGCIGITHDYHLVYDYGKLARTISEKNNISIEEAIEFTRFGNAAASICVERRGAIPAMPALEEVKERL